MTITFDDCQIIGFKNAITTINSDIPIQLNRTTVVAGENVVLAINTLEHLKKYEWYPHHLGEAEIQSSFQEAKKSSEPLKALEKTKFGMEIINSGVDFAKNIAPVLASLF